jgi:hypothetical protein
MHGRGVVQGVVLAGALLVTSCGDVMSPLRKLAEVGKEPYVFFVADASDGQPDLFVARADGREVRPATFTPNVEAAPSLSPDGGMLAFLRGASASRTSPMQLWVMNLITGAERQLEVPAGSPPLTRVGWAADGTAIYVQAGEAVLKIAPPPERGVAGPVSVAERAAADSALEVFVGDPPFARVAPCANPADLCVLGATGEQVLAAGAGVAGGVRWGGDSVAYIEHDTLLVRPVGPGRERRVPFVPDVTRPRALTYFRGTLRR